MLDEEYLALLLAADDPASFEWPEGYDWRAEQTAFSELAEEFAEMLGVSCKRDETVEDASYLGEIYLPPSLLAKPLLPQRALGCTFTHRATISVSNWGRFYTIYFEDHVLPRITEQIKEFMAAKGYVYIPERILKLPYTGPFPHMHAQDPKWGNRFFDYG